jgi:phage protein D
MPTIDQPRPDLSLDGQMRPDLSAALLELEVVVPAHGVSGMRARLGVLPGTDVDQTFGWAGLSIGGRLVVTTQHAAAVFVGDITRVAEHYGDGPPTVTIVARDGLHRLDRAVRSRVFEDMTLADVVAAVAGEADLTSTVPNDDDERRWVQVGETDLQFLLRHVSERGLMLRLVDGLVTVRRMTPTGTGVVVSPATARRLELAADVAGASTAVTVAGWHLSEGVGVEQTAVPSAAPPGQHAAAEVLDGLGWPATRRLTRDMVGIDTARRLATGVVSHPQSRLLDGVVELADPSVAPARPVSVTGVSPRFAGRWMTTDVIHRFDSTAGWVTRAALVRDAWPAASAGRRRPT